MSIRWNKENTKFKPMEMTAYMNASVLASVKFPATFAVIIFAV